MNKNKEFEFLCLFQLHILLTIILTFDAITRYRQRHRCLFLSNYFNVHLIKNNFPVLFEPFALKTNNHQIFYLVNNQRVDQDIYEFMKYIINFIFYRFGLEVKKKRRFYIR
jgi:hypothetical protein